MVWSVVMHLFSTVNSPNWATPLVMRQLATGQGLVFVASHQVSPTWRSSTVGCRQNVVMSPKSWDIYGVNSRIPRRTCPQSAWRVATRKLEQLDSAIALEDLRIPPGNRLEALTGNRHGRHSIRINDQYRICFVWTESGPDDVG